MGATANRTYRSVATGFDGIVDGSQLIRSIDAPNGTAIARMTILLCIPASRSRTVSAIVMNSANKNPAAICSSRMFSTIGSTGASAAGTEGGEKVALQHSW